MPILPLDTLEFFCLSVDIKIATKQAHGEQHMGWYAIHQYILETIILSRTMVQAKEAVK